MYEVERSRKRIKVSGHQSTASTYLITNPSQLEDYLRFRQNSNPEVEAAIKSFRLFLENISSCTDDTEKSAKLRILKSYCDSQASAAHDQVDFPDLLKTWSFAAEVSNDAVLSTVPATLAQFFRTISNSIQFRDFGLSLCHSLLKREQTRLFDRGLSAPFSKYDLISSCLELLAEIVSFDGGALAGKVFARRDYLYRRLESALGKVDSTKENHTTGSVKESARTAAISFVLANLKYLEAEAKAEIITQGKIIYALVRNLSGDKPTLVIATLGQLDSAILNDEHLSSQSKRRCFNSGVLAQLAELYDYAWVGEDPSNAEAKSTEVRHVAHQLLMKICTTKSGIGLPQSGWYPAGVNPDLFGEDDEAIDLGFDSPYYLDDVKSSTNVKNGTLATFLQTLHPEKDVLQSKLVVECMNALPELVADYFTRKPKLLVPPGDDPLWRGQFAFLFSIVQLSVPTRYGVLGELPPVPPPLNIVVESIVPRPLDRATLMKCLQMNDEVMTISAVRITTVALEKLDSVLNLLHNKSTESTIWKQAAERLTALVTQRVATLPEVIAALQRLKQDQERVRKFVLECIAAYCKFLPSITASSKFDISPLLSSVLSKGACQTSDEGSSTVAEQLSHLLTIASLSTATKWLHRPSDDLTLVANLLQLVTELKNQALKEQVVGILKALLVRRGILCSKTRAFDALLLSLEETGNWTPSPELFTFLDNCLTRTAQRPVKYTDILLEMRQALPQRQELSLLAVCVYEQWTFAVKKVSKHALKNMAVWIARFYTALSRAGEDADVLAKLKEEMLAWSEVDSSGNEALAKAFKKASKKLPVLPDVKEGQNQRPLDAQMGNQISASDAPVDMSSAFPSPPSIPSSLTGLDRWPNPDFESDSETRRLCNVVRCLISSDQETRLHAYHIIQTVSHAVEQGTYAEKNALCLLLGELCGTVRDYNAAHGTSSAPPSIVAEIAVYLLPTLLNPSSPSYRKANKFLLRAPSWTINSLLPHLLANVLLSESDGEDSTIAGNAYSADVSALLQLFANSMRTAADVDLFRRAGVFGRLFALYLAPVCPKASRRQILQIVYNTARVPGGSDTLVTRCGVLEWLRVAGVLTDHSGHGATFGKVDGDLKHLAEAVEQKVRTTCDALAIEKWEKERPIFREHSKDKF